jgi:ABC-type sugar transport system, periplasmic component
MKKAFIYIFLAAFILSALTGAAGCKKKSGKIEVSIGMWPESSDPKSVEMFTGWKENFERDHPEYEIVPAPYTYNPDTFVPKALSGTLPTVFQTYFTEPKKLIASNFIKDVTSELQTLGWYDKMEPGMRETVSSVGKVYGVPRDGYGLGLFLNLAMLYDVGVIGKKDGKYVLYDEGGEPLYPTSFQEIREVSELIAASYGNTYGLVILSANKNGGWQFSNMAWNFGSGDLQTQNGSGWHANLNSPGAVAALEWIKSMAEDELICPGASFSYADWYAKVGSGNAAMAFAGSDALSLPVTNFGFDKDDIGFVPMPTGDGVSQYSLFGGTPYVFSSGADDEEIMGALLFLKYMGRSPETDEISLAAMRKGFEVAQAKNLPILPTIRPWVNEDFLAAADDLDREFINVNLDYYKDFLGALTGMRRTEEPFYTQEMYSLLDNAIQAVLSEPYSSVPASLLQTANAQFQSAYLSKM